MDRPDSPPLSPPPSPVSQGEADYGVVLDMVESLKDKLSALNLDNNNIRVACDALRQQCQDQDVAFGNLTRLVRESLDGRPPQCPQTKAGRPHPIIRSDLIDDRGNLRATDIGITWQGRDTFLHGVRVVGTNEDTHHLRPRPATSTPYSPVREHPPCIMSTPRSTHPVCLETPVTPAHRTGQEGRPGYRPAAPIQRFNNKTISWPAWFRHFKAVADVHGWDKDQRALQLVSYLDEKAMNVAQELSDQELYNYDVLVKLLGDRFDPASRVSASRSRFHGRTRRHQDDADTYADSITELCRLGYPQSSPELRQELISDSLIPNWKNICGLWFGLKRIGSSKPSSRCVPISPASATPRTSTDQQNRYSHWRRTTTRRRRCSLWWIVHRGQRNHLCHWNYSRCSLSHGAWYTRCDRLLAVPTPLAGHRIPRHHRVRDIVHRFDLVATTPR